MTQVLLALDIDGTLADTAHLAPLFEQDPDAWCAAITHGDYRPLREAAHALVALPATASVVVVTARSRDLFDATSLWLDRHFRALRGSELRMREPDDERPAWQSKRAHLEEMRGERSVVLVDDDPLAQRALRLEDTLLIPPQDWPLLGRALGAR